MIDPANRNLSIVRQCRLLKVSRSGWHYKPKEASPFNLCLMRIIDEQFLATAYGSRQMTRQLRRSGYRVKPQACHRRFDEVKGPASDLPGSKDQPSSPPT